MAGFAAGRALSDLGLEQYATRRAGTLSLGNRQRVCLAAALVHGPDMLVLDEPTNTLDPPAVSSFYVGYSRRHVGTGAPPSWSPATTWMRSHGWPTGSACFIGSVLIGVALPVLAAAFMVAATSDGSSQIGLKAAAMLTGAGWAGYFAMVGMLLAVGALMGIGFVVCWCFGREFTEKTQACLFTLPVSRRRLAYAKFTVILLWAPLLCLLSVAVALPAGAAIGLGMPGPEDLMFAGKAWCAGVLADVLARPLAVVASVSGTGGLLQVPMPLAGP